MKKRYLIGFLILSVGVIIGFVNVISHLKSFDVIISNSKNQMGGEIVFAKMDNSVFAISLKSGHINAFNLKGDFLYASRVSIGLKDDLKVEYKEDLVYISHEYIPNKYLVFDSSGYLGETNFSPKTKYVAKKELEFNTVRFRSEPFGRIFINLGDMEKQLTYISFWNWYWNDIGVIFILPLVGIILLLPWMIDLLSKQTHNSSVFYRTKQKKW